MLLMKVGHCPAKLAAVDLGALKLRATSDGLAAICSCLFGDNALTGQATLSARDKWQLAAEVHEVVPVQCTDVFPHVGRNTAMRGSVVPAN